MTEKEETDAKQAPKKNLNQGHRSRMRKRYLTCGFSGFQEHEILELLLFYALPRVNTNPIAHQLLKEFHSLAGVLDADSLPVNHPGTAKSSRGSGAGSRISEHAAGIVSLLSAEQRNRTGKPQTIGD